MTEPKPSKQLPSLAPDSLFNDALGDESSEEFADGSASQPGLGERKTGEGLSTEGQLDARIVKKRVVDSLVTAVELAALKQIKDAETIRYLMRSWYKDYFHGNTVDLSMFHKALCGEEGMIPDDAALPCLIFLAAQGIHGYEVKLPLEVESRKDVETLFMKAEKHIQIHGGYQRLFDEVASRNPAPSPDEVSLVVKYDRPPRDSEVRDKTADEDYFKKGKRKGIGYTPRRALAVGIVMTLSLGLFIGSFFINTQQWAEPFDLSPVRPILELRQGLKTEFTLNALISDSRWPTLPEDQRRVIVNQLLDQLFPRGVQRLVLYTERNPFAVVALASGPGQVGRQVIIQDQLTAPPMLNPSQPSGSR